MRVLMHYTSGGRLMLSSDASEGNAEEVFFYLPQHLSPQVSAESDGLTGWSYSTVNIADEDCDVDIGRICGRPGPDGLLVAADASTAPAGSITLLDLDASQLETAANGHHFVRALGVACLDPSAAEKIDGAELELVGCVGSDSSIAFSMNARSGGAGATMSRVSPGIEVFKVGAGSVEPSAGPNGEIGAANNGVYEYWDQAEVSRANSLLLLAGALLGLAAAEIVARLNHLSRRLDEGKRRQIRPDP